jgi:hypothetical protein
MGKGYMVSIISMDKAMSISEEMWLHLYWSLLDKNYGDQWNQQIYLLIIWLFLELKHLI